MQPVFRCDKLLATESAHRMIQTCLCIEQPPAIHHSLVVGLAVKWVLFIHQGEQVCGLCTGWGLAHPTTGLAWSSVWPSVGGMVFIWAARSEDVPPARRRPVLHGQGGRWTDELAEFKVWRL